MDIAEMIWGLILGAFGGFLFLAILATIIYFREGVEGKSVKPYRIFYVPMEEKGWKFQSILIEARDVDEAIEKFMRKVGVFDIAYIVEATRGVWFGYREREKLPIGETHV
ncbi:MAG: hypothetical protein MRT15_11765 [archaeon YNP-LCB-003-016]|uniref:hypothetical protein n=1 Tax=Candidatus Culexarchaeum yellowstonense TaxID=2928963 RepID=UPI0026EEA986|nr:hypothetical protein [Candidatus Culexarchaeum yellowstonense]MCR6693062.1 hypothetical protein [Candidatus Culexarchaeum yellowstonense]